MPLCRHSFTPTRRQAASVEPIMRLMAGILLDAVRCFQRHFDARESNRRQDFREVESWIFDDMGNGPSLSWTFATG
jgi:hypothetical protein